MVPTNWVSLFGSFVLLVTLLATTYAGGAAVAGARLGSRRLVHSAIYAAYASCALLSLASAMIFFAILSNDFSIRYIHHNADASMPWIYKLTSYWGGLDGSMMFWAWLLSIFAAIAIARNRERHRELMPWVVAILMGILAFFVSLVVFYKRPFDTFLTEAPVIGKGLNPLLQDPYMATHPPSLYTGYVSASIPFAFGMAALITGNLDDSWLQSVRRWMLLCWYFLSQGLILGSLWAYHVLGWGGYWGWDPVENAGILPWFTATAFLHSMMIQERRGMMKVWNVVLVILTFLLTLVGTFMTRSGIVQSVHAFGNDPELAARFLAFIGFMTCFSIGYVIYRLPLLRSRGELDSWVSREFSFLFNNWVLVGAAFFILVATLFPTLSEAITRNRVTVGPPFFNKWMAGIGLNMLVLTGIGPLIAWRKASVQMLVKQFVVPVSVGVLATVLLALVVPESRIAVAFLHDRLRLPAPLVCFGISAFVLTSIAQEFIVGARARQQNTKSDFFTALVGLVARNKRRYGGYLVHVGVVLMFIGFAGSAYQKENDATLSVGQTTKLGRYEIKLDGFHHSSDPQKEVQEVRLSITADGKSIGELRPAKWSYRGHEEEPPRTIVTIKESLLEDLYIILNGTDNAEAVASIKVIINPLVNWVWFGFALLMLGTAIAFLPERAYDLAAKSAKTAATATGVVALLFIAGQPAIARADNAAMHQSTEGNNFPTPPRNETEKELRKTLVCMCGCGRQTLSECTCGFAAKERGFIARLLDEGKSRDEVVKAFLARYPGESALVVAARRWGRNSRGAGKNQKQSAAAAPGGKPDRVYEDRLDDELDELN